MRNARTRIVVEAGLTLALAAVLGWLTPLRMPYGGSASLEMVPLIVFALRHGVGWGVLVGALYGGVDFMVHPTAIVHPAQLVLDYPVAFGLVGLAGLFAPMRRRSDAGVRRIVVATVAATLVAGAGRFAAHVASGIVFFGSYAPEGQPVLVYSVVYNLTYMLPSTLASLALALLLVPALERAAPFDR